MVRTFQWHLREAFEACCLEAVYIVALEIVSLLLVADDEGSPTALATAKYL